MSSVRTDGVDPLPQLGHGETANQKTRQVPEPGTTPFVTVILPARNAAATLPEQLEALRRQTYAEPWELLVVDNGSTDGTADLVRSWSNQFTRLRVIQASERAGINYARNAGARAAEGEFLLFCDSDDRAHPEWIAAMASAARGCDLVGGRLDDTTLNDETTRAWRPAFPADRLPTALGFLPYAIGANCGTSAHIWRELGGFNESHAVGAADVEYFWRAQLAGYRLCYVSEAMMEYRYRTGLKTLGRQFYRYGRAEPQLFARFREYGLSRSGLLSAARTWAWIVAHLPDLIRNMERRGIWLQKAAYRWGRLVGSVRYRALYL